MRIIYGLLPLVLPELELRCGAGSPNHDCAWQGLLRYRGTNCGTVGTYGTYGTYGNRNLRFASSF